MIQAMLPHLLAIAVLAVTVVIQYVVIRRLAKANITQQTKIDEQQHELEEIKQKLK